MSKSFDRKIRLFPALLSLDVTKRCNLRCLHCYNESGDPNERDLSETEIMALLPKILELHPENVCLCGGEPLLFRPLTDVIDCLKTNGVITVSMVSNGYLMTPDLAEKLVKHGLSQIQISLDGAFSWQHDSLRGMDGAFDRAVSSIRMLKNAGIPLVMVSMLPDKLNQHSLPEYFELCRSLGVNAIRMMPYLPMGRGHGIGRSLLLSDEEYFHLLRTFVTLKERYRTVLMANWLDPVRTVRAAFTDEIPAGYSMCIRSDGSVAADSYLPFTFGNVRDESPLSIYRRMVQEETTSSEIRQRVLSTHQLFDLEG